jgi:hypothetical protein
MSKDWPFEAKWQSLLEGLDKVIDVAFDKENKKSLSAQQAMTLYKYAFSPPPTPFLFSIMSFLVERCMIGAQLTRTRRRRSFTSNLEITWKASSATRKRFSFSLPSLNRVFSSHHAFCAEFERVSR